MKTHAFVRTNAGKVVNYQLLKEKSLKEYKNSEKSKLYPIPTIEKHLYFLFAPTLVYRDEYPR
jgi:sterol O-acyltransferase